MKQFIIIDTSVPPHMAYLGSGKWCCKAFARKWSKADAEMVLASLRSNVGYLVPQPPNKYVTEEI